MSRKKRPIVTRAGNIGIMEFANVAYSFEIAGSSTITRNLAQPGILPLANVSLREMLPLTIGPFKIAPNGDDNNFPYTLRDTLEENNLAEGVFKRQRGLLWGKGPRLFRTDENEDEDGAVRPVNDPEILTWLCSWNYIEYLRRCVVDYYHAECVFSKCYLTKGWRIGQKPRIAKLEHIGYENCRLEWPDDNVNPNGVVIGDWLNRKIANLTRFPIFDPQNPFKHPISVHYQNMYSFARKFYGLPAYYGSLSWLKRGSAIPRILEALTKNSLNIKWHIKSPASYWESKREILRGQAQLKGEQYDEKMLEDLKDAIFGKLAEVLAGEANVGKFFTSEKCINELGQLESWEIEPIDQKVKDFIDSQITIAKQADSATTSGLGLHPSLSNIIVDGKLASGSEQLYAYKIYQATETAIPEDIILTPINIAIALNFPDSNLKLGFYRPIVKSEQVTTPEDRVKNQV